MPQEVILKIQIILLSFFSFIMFELISAILSWKLLWQFEFKSHSYNLMVIMYPMGNDFKMSQNQIPIQAVKV